MKNQQPVCLQRPPYLPLLLWQDFLRTGFATQLNQAGCIFSAAEEQEITQIIRKYPEGCARSAVVPLLDWVQRRQGGYLTRACIEAVASKLDLPYMRVYEIATFYTMFYHRWRGSPYLKCIQT